MTLGIFHSSAVRNTFHTTLYRKDEIKTTRKCSSDTKKSKNKYEKIFNSPILAPFKISLF